jgi:hypothetical protein
MKTPMKPGRKSLANTKAFSGPGLEAVKRFALMGDLPGSAYGVVHCLDGIISKHPDFDASSAASLLQNWVRELQDVRLDLIQDKRLREDVNRWIRQRPGTNFDLFIEILRILTLIVAPLVRARREKDGTLIDALGKFLRSSEPESKDNYTAISRQKPVHPGLWAAVESVERAQKEQRKPTLRDVEMALGLAGRSTAKRYAAKLRAAGVEFDRTPGRKRTCRQIGSKHSG